MKCFVLYDAYDDSSADIWGVFDSIDTLKKFLWEQALEYASKENADSYLNNWQAVECEINTVRTEDDRYDNKYNIGELFTTEEVNKLISIINKRENRSSK